MNGVFNMKRVLYYTVSFLLGTSCFFGIPMFFIGSNFLSDLLASTGKLKVDPSFTGGKVARDFIDELDEGKKLRRYTVYQPVYDARWQQNPDYWQIEQTYDMDARKFSNIKVFLEDNENNRYKLVISNDESWIEDLDLARSFGCETYFSRDGKSIKTRIPLEDRKLQKLYVVDTTCHRIYADESEQTSVRVKMKEEVKNKDIKENIKRIKNAYCEMKEKIRGKPGHFENAELDEAYLLFENGRYDEAESAFKKILDSDSDSIPANAYYGSCVAIRGGNSNVFKAMKLVNQSFAYLDKAVKLSEGTPYEMEALLNRAEVSASVPNSVFGKMETAACDFEKCARILEEHSKVTILSQEDTILLAYLYASAAECNISLNRELEARKCVEKSEKCLAL